MCLLFTLLLALRGAQPEQQTGKSYQQPSRSSTIIETWVLQCNKCLQAGIPHGLVLHGECVVCMALQVPDDGRELVVTVPDAVKVRAEDGRRVAGCNISPFINNLPGGRWVAAWRRQPHKGWHLAANGREGLCVYPWHH